MGPHDADRAPWSRHEHQPGARLKSTAVMLMAVATFGLRKPRDRTGRAKPAHVRDSAVGEDVRWPVGRRLGQLPGPADQA